MARPVSDLQAHLGYWLRMVSNNVSHAFAARLEAEGVTVAEWVVMRELLGKGAVAPSQLAGELGLTRGAVSKLQDRLITKRLVARRDNPADARAHTLELTEPGTRLVPRLAALADENDSEFFGVLSPAEHAELLRLLRALAERRGLRSKPVD